MKVKGKGFPEIPAADLGEAIVSTWRGLGATSVGARELLAIQEALPAEMSPASIARELAAAGAALRHPEIIECDARWREKQIAKQTRPFAGLAVLQERGSLRLRDAEAAITRLETLRAGLRAGDDEAVLDEIKKLAIDARQRALNSANDPSLSSSRREEQAEIAEWLRVWLETPHLFAQWVDLRKASAAFAKKFATG
jgi:hypothetical protein